MKYKVISKTHHIYEDANIKLVRYTLVIEAGGLRFVDCSVAMYMAAKIGLDIDI